MFLPDEPIPSELVTARSEQEVAVEDQVVGMGPPAAALKMRFMDARIG
jgi:hypothetical protein